MDDVMSMSSLSECGVVGKEHVIEASISTCPIGKRRKSSVLSASNHSLPIANGTRGEDEVKESILLTNGSRVDEDEDDSVHLSKEDIAGAVVESILREYGSRDEEDNAKDRLHNGLSGSELSIPFSIIKEEQRECLSVSTPSIPEDIEGDDCCSKMMKSMLSIDYASDYAMPEMYASKPDPEEAGTSGQIGELKGLLTKQEEIIGKLEKRVAALEIDVELLKLESECKETNSRRINAGCPFDAGHSGSKKRTPNSLLHNCDTVDNAAVLMDYPPHIGRERLGKYICTLS